MQQIFRNTLKTFFYYYSKMRTLKNCEMKFFIQKFNIFFFSFFKGSIFAIIKMRNTSSKVSASKKGKKELKLFKFARTKVNKLFFWYFLSFNIGVNRESCIYSFISALLFSFLFF